MSTKAGTIGIAGRPTGFVVWTAIVSTLAAAALIMSALALVEARDHGSIEAASGELVGVASTQAPLWDAGKLEAMQGRVLAASVGSQGFALWDAGKLEAMRGRVLASTVPTSSPLWDAGKLEAMKGRVLAG